ncbi:RDD family protein [Mesoplasma lactucae]|nr:RDD family protein [Mesoplasma lactucae]ATZ19921.1 hypothetical protein MLACT_v1c00970 [Mesoplasma lactucae ATCC 49193]MCL8216785.1 hypothetical protein [Mesoplasma lactucae ATCC 49193]
MKNEINKIDNSVSTNVNKEQNKDETYALANVWRIFWCRCVDIILSAIPGFVASGITGQYVYESQEWLPTVINLSVGLVAIIIYFMVIPMCCNGNTLGKLMFGIRLKRQDGIAGNHKPKWYMLIARESYFLLIPWAVALIFFIVAIVVMKESAPSTDADRNAKGSVNVGAMIIYQLGYVFYFLWFVFLCVSIKVQPNHQSGLDIKFKLFDVYKNPVGTVKTKVTKKEVLDRGDHHVALTDMPGNFDNGLVTEVKTKEKVDYEKTINLDDLDVKPTDSKKITSKTKIEEIEHHNDKDNDDWGD